MIRQRLKVAARGLLLVVMAVLLVVGDPTTMALAAPIEGDTEHKGDLDYYTNNGIIFYDGGQLYCGADSQITGGAGGMLTKQSSLDKEWVPIILNAAKEADADPVAMASLLFWENRGFPKIDAQWGGSDSIGRGPWQIVKGTWPASAGPYAKGVVDPVISTGVAANLVESWGGKAGIPIGSIDQDFSKGSNIPSMATVAKNYNAGRFTWREPGVAGYKAGGRSWKQPSGTWFGQKQTIIDEYIMAMTYAYYLMGTGQQLPAKGKLDNDAFVAKAVQNADNIKKFKIGDGANVANECEQETGATPGDGNGDIVKTAEGLAWKGREKDNQQQKSAATALYQKVMPQIQGRGTANSVDSRGRTAWSDCGLFVSTVMRYSGADKKYAQRGTGTQLAYVRRHKEKYDVFTNLNNTGQLKPGDIFIIDGHTFLHTHKTPYKGTDGKKYNGFSASWGDRVPMANNTYFSDSRGHYTVARLKAPANPAPAAAGGQ